MICLMKSAWKYGDAGQNIQDVQVVGRVRGEGDDGWP